ncbi:hypothetical protein ON010_g15900 [Phytophthora cinnamomi]|nr:hypothetical protein ON010_g15900 [Phytophthora cinnamomi]
MVQYRKAVRRSQARWLDYEPAPVLTEDELGLNWPSLKPILLSPIPEERLESGRVLSSSRMNSLRVGERLDAVGAQGLDAAQCHLRHRLRELRSAGGQDRQGVAELGRGEVLISGACCLCSWPPASSEGGGWTERGAGRAVEFLTWK